MNINDMLININELVRPACPDSTCVSINSFIRLIHASESKFKLNDKNRSNSFI